MTIALVTVVVVVLVAAGLLLALEHWLRTRAPGLLEDRLAEALATSCSVALGVGSGPLAHARALLLDRCLPTLTVSARDVPLDGRDAELTRLEARVENLPLIGPRLRPEPGSATGRFTAHLDDDGLPGLLRLPPVVQGLAVHGDGLRITTVAGVALTCDVDLTDGAVRVRPRSPSALARLPWPEVVAVLPDLPFDAHVEHLVLEDGHVIVEGTFDTGSLAT